MLKEKRHTLPASNMSSDSPNKPAPRTDDIEPLAEGTQILWADYALARFGSAEDRIKEFRNTARQLGAALAVIVGLEVTLITKILDAKPTLSEVYPMLALVALFAAVIFKTALLFRVFSLGYATRELIGPEGPRMMRGLLIGKGENEAREIIARYYANACDGAAEEGGLYALAESLGKALKGLSRQAAASVSLLVLGVLIWSGWSILRPQPIPYNPPVVAQQPKAPQPPPPPRPTPPSAPPTASPSLPTPTKGVPLHEGTHQRKP